MTNTKRAIPTLKEFYATKAATTVYTKLLLQSSLNMETKNREFEYRGLSVSALAENLGFNRTTLIRHLKALETATFIIQEKDKIIFPKTHIYTLIQKETLEYLSNVGNQYVISVYAELAWRWAFYVEKQNGAQKVYFTQSVLLEALGLTPYNNNHKVIRDILESLKKQGFIDWEVQKTQGFNQVMILTKFEKTVELAEVKEVEPATPTEEKEISKQLNYRPSILDWN